MLFSSIEFFLFLSVFVIAIFFLKNNQRNIIIIFSLFFYSYWNYFFFPLIIFFCLATYFLIKKNLRLIISIPLILLPLIYFKYSLFLVDLLNLDLLREFSYKGELPLAISFVTFTIIAVLVDRKNQENDQYNLKNLSEYILYFPQLIAGPILRLKQLFPQLNNKISFIKENIKIGIILFCIGYIKKVFFADNIALLIDPYFEDPQIASRQDLIQAFLLFPVQIYFDFSGYVDMALGVSKIFGINLPQNFNMPYHATSITDFWRRWHITLSNWFKDYLYIPLGGSKNGKLKNYLNLIVTMTIAGIWHGASLNFILWGFLNGIILCFEKLFNLVSLKYNFIKNIFACFIIFNLWIFFRISDFPSIIVFFDNLYLADESLLVLENFLTLFFVIIIVFLQKFENHNFLFFLSKKLNFSFIISFFLIILLLGFSISLGQSEKFIYFQF